jgi:integral membrane protein (TIGR01906 family)
VNGSAGRAIAAIGVGISTAVVLVGLAVAVFFNPWFVAFEQSRANAAVWTGYTPDQLRTATDGILNDLYLGNGGFAVAVNGVPVLDARERQHMQDVRGVFVVFWALVLAGAVVLAAASWRSRRARWFWRAVGWGATVTGIGVIVLGAIAFVAFDALFEVFHRLFFAGGSYTFDPRSERLVQLFPDAFWFETSIFLGGVVLLLAVALRVLAGRRVGGGAVRPTGPPAVPVESAR